MKWVIDEVFLHRPEDGPFLKCGEVAPAASHGDLALEVWLRSDKDHRVTGRAFVNLSEDLDHARKFLDAIALEDRERIVTRIGGSFKLLLQEFRGVIVEGEPQDKDRPLGLLWKWKAA